MRKNKKATIIGHFAEGHNFLDGQTIKTKIVTKELERVLGEEQVGKIDTYGKWKSLVKSPFHVFKALKQSDNVLIFPAHNGLRVYALLLRFFKKFFKNKKTHYIVIGGWLPKVLSENKRLIKSVKKIDYIYVETSTMKRALENMGFDNVQIMLNCKELPIVNKEELDTPIENTFRLCTFSRVMKEKGIEDAIEVIKNINEKEGQNIFSLDIYGPIDSNQKEWFENLKNNFPTFVKYRGCVDSNKSVEILKDYFMLLFPTRFFTEGIPGTIIDAYAAGVPILSAK